MEEVKVHISFKTSFTTTHKSNQKIIIMDKIMATRLALVIHLNIMPKFLNISSKMNISLVFHGRSVQGWTRAAAL